MKRPEPLLLLDPADEPAAEAADWRRANALFAHPGGCRCSTCALAARLGYRVRQQEASRAQ